MRVGDGHESVEGGPLRSNHMAKTTITITIESEDGQINVNTVNQPVNPMDFMTQQQKLDYLKRKAQQITKALGGIVRVSEDAE